MNNYGATPEDWDNFSLILGLTADLLPVVSNPNAEIDPESTLAGLGKTPSKYNRNKKVVGFGKWTEHISTFAEIEAWRKQPDYGICVQTRHVRAFDLDLTEEGDVKHAIQAITKVAGALPIRVRSNAHKCLLVFTYEGELTKRIIRAEHGIIELLATGQQFIACGTHTSGVPYSWQSLRDEIPAITEGQLERIWATLTDTFATEASITSKASTKKLVLTNAIEADPVAQFLIDNNHVRQIDRMGQMHITCPFQDEHTSAGSISETTYFPAHTGGYENGHFRCLHAHCEHRTDDDFKEALGIPISDPFDDFEDISGDDPPEEAPTLKKFALISAKDFSKAKPMQWIIKGVLPQADLAVVYGESGSGKTFFVLDLAEAVSTGNPWRGRRVSKGAVVYICAEGAGGMRARLQAMAMHKGIDLDDLDLWVISDVPNFMAANDVKAIIAQIKAFGSPVALVIIDTFAQVMPGANENAGEDVGKALSHCRALNKHTGALVMLIHHSGKDAAKGARGWSGLRGACDVEIEINRDEHDRSATITKMKDGNDGETFGFRLNTVVIDMDEDGEAVTSCVLEDVEGLKVERSRGRKAMKVAGKYAAAVLRAVGDLAGLGDSKVAYAEVLAAATDMIEVTGENDRRRELIVREVTKMLDKGDIVDVGGGFLALPGVDSGAGIA